MASQPVPGAPKPKGLPNPYANLLLPNTHASATVASAAPVKYTEEQAKAEQQKKAPAFHNPHMIKRPQAKNTGPAIRRGVMPTVKSTLAGQAPPATAAQRHGIEWYRSTAEDDAAIIEERRQRNREEKQKKKEQKKFNKMFGQWNPQAPHKPDRYSNLRAYRASGGYRRKKEGFNAFLRGAANQSRHTEENLSANEPKISTMAAKLSFAPPACLNEPTEPADDDPYIRRMRLAEKAQSAVSSPAPAPPSEASCAVPPPPSVADEHPPADSLLKPAPTSAPTFQSPMMYASAAKYANATISAPPVRFDRPAVQVVDEVDEKPVYDPRPAKRVKISKAEAMMAKMGYKKGEGLGKNSDGVVSHLEVKKRKVPQGRGSPSDDSKVKAQQVWDVRGGERTKKDEPSQFGEESSVVVTWGCVEGVNWDDNSNRNDGGIRQEMGEAFSNKFGPVEHIVLDEKNKDGTVYIHFKSILSALNAVNRFDEGWEFRNRRITAKYYDERKFHAGIFEH